MTNVEIAKVFNEYDSFVANAIENIKASPQGGYIGYLIFEDDHLPLTDEQQKIMDEYGDCGEIELNYDWNINDIIG